jgi:hypothetical protein
MRYIYLLAVFLIVSCATPRPEMTHVDDDADFDRDYYACLDEAEQSLSDERSKFSNITVHDSILEKRILLCMISKGWHETE